MSIAEKPRTLETLSQRAPDLSIERTSELANSTKEKTKGVLDVTGKKWDLEAVKKGGVLTGRFILRAVDFKNLFGSWATDDLALSGLSGNPTVEEWLKATKNGFTLKADDLEGEDLAAYLRLTDNAL